MTTLLTSDAVSLAAITKKGNFMGKTPAQEVLDDQAAQDAELGKAGIITDKLDEVQTPTTEDGSEEGAKDLSDEDEYQANLKDEEEGGEDKNSEPNPIKARDRFKNRGEKRREEIDSLKSEFKEELGGIKSMLEEMKASGKGKEETKDALNEELDKFIKDNELNEESQKMVRGLATVLEKQLEAKYKPIEEKLSSRDEQEFWVKDAQIFNQNWTNTEKELRSLYPNASATQITEAKELMDDYAHSEDYGYVEGKHDPMTQDYILYKEADAFDSILHSPKKKSFESGKNAPVADASDDEIDWDAPVNSLAEATKRQKILDAKVGQPEAFTMREGRRLK